MTATARRRKAKASKGEHIPLPKEYQKEAEKMKAKGYRYMAQMLNEDGTPFGEPLAFKTPDQMSKFMRTENTRIDWYSTIARTKTKAAANNPGTVNELKQMGILPPGENPGSYPEIGQDDTWESLYADPAAATAAKKEIISTLLKAKRPDLANAVARSGPGRRDPQEDAFNEAVDSVVKILQGAGFERVNRNKIFDAIDRVVAKVKKTAASPTRKGSKQAQANLSSKALSTMSELSEIMTDTMKILHTLVRKNKGGMDISPFRDLKDELREWATTVDDTIDSLERETGVGAKVKSIAKRKRTSAIGPPRDPKQILSAVHELVDELTVGYRLLRTAKMKLGKQGIDTNEWDGAIKAVYAANTAVSDVADNLEDELDRR